VLLHLGDDLGGRQSTHICFSFARQTGVPMDGLVSYQEQHAAAL
jgi:hypothetical protein